MTELNKIMDVENFLEAKRKINSFMDKIGLSLNLPNTIDYDLEVSRVIENVNMERLANHPVKVETSDLMKIFKSLCQ